MSDATVLQKDAAILRERLAWVHKRVPRDLQHLIEQSLSRYASAVAAYCTHSERAFIARENATACLDCGARTPSPVALVKD